MTSYPPPIIGRKIRFALVGCGRISRNHLAALEQLHNETELVAACDVDASALEEVVAKTGAQGFGSLPALLSDSHPDVVVLATPSGLHSEQTLKAAKAGYHVVTEKPMATRWEDGKRMVQACRSAGVQLFIVKQNRLNDTLRLLKRAIVKGRFGRIYMVVINVFWTRPQSYYAEASWRGNRDMDGGAFMNQASHYVDLLDWLFGPVESVQAYTGTLGRKIEAEDTGVASVRWRSGALGSINVTMLTYPKNLEASLTIIGEKGTVRLGGVAVNEIQHWEFAEPDPDDVNVREASRATTSGLGAGHPAYYDNVIRVLRGKAEPETDGHEGLKSLELLIAIYRSARDGERVSLPLE